MKRSKLVIFTILFFTSTGYSKTFNYGFVEPFLYYEDGKYKFDDAGDNGSFYGAGVGTRVGYNLFFLRAGGETFSMNQIFSSDKELTDAQRDEYPVSTRSFHGVGVFLGLNFSRVQIYYTTFFDLRMKARIKNNIETETYGRYKYHGTGGKIHVNLRLIGGLSLGYGYFSYKFDTYDLDRDINSLTAAQGATRSALEVSGSTYSLTLTIPIKKDLFKALGQSK